MATFSTTLSHGAPYVSINIESYEQSYNAAANYSIVYWRAYVNITSGSRTGNWDWNAYVDGNYVGGGSVSPSNWSGEHTLGSGTITVYHDANGYKTVSCSSYLDDYYAQATASGSYALTRLPLAPTISSVVVSNIKANEATITTSISSNGHGTSTTVTTYYRVLNTGSYISVGTGSPKIITGLSSAKTYQYYVTAINNNGDVATSSVGTFVTKSGGKLIYGDGSTAECSIKQISSTGVVSDCSVKIIV